MLAGKPSSISTYVGSIVGGAAGGAVLAGTGNAKAAAAVEAGVSAGITTLGNGIEDMARGKREVSWKSVGNLALNTVKDAAIGGATGFIAGEIIKKGGKVIEKATSKIGGRIGKIFSKKSIDTMLSPFKTIKEKIFKRVGLTGRNSWDSLTKQVYTKLKTGTWSISSLSRKSWGKMIGFEVTDTVWGKMVGKIFKDPKDYLSQCMKNWVNESLLQVNIEMSPEQFLIKNTLAQLGLDADLEINAEIYCVE